MFTGVGVCFRGVGVGVSVHWCSTFILCSLALVFGGFGDGVDVGMGVSVGVRLVFAGVCVVVVDENRSHCLLFSARWHWC